MTQFIVNYIGSLTGFSFERSVLERIAMERGVDRVSDVADLTEKDKDLITADLLYVAFFSPAETASMTKKHGTFAITIGSQYITNRGALWRMMKRLYDKWGEEDKLGDTNEGGLQWME